MFYVIVNGYKIYIITGKFREFTNGFFICNVHGKGYKLLLTYRNYLYTIFVVIHFNCCE